MNEMIDTLELRLARSPLMQFARQRREAQADARRNEGFHAPNADEIRLLEQLGNYSPDWSKVLFHKPFHPRRIIRSNFFGECRVGVPQRRNVPVEAGVVLDTGIYRSTLTNCAIDDNCYLMNVGALAQTVVERDAILFNVQLVGCAGAALFGNGGRWCDSSASKKVIFLVSREAVELNSFFHVHIFPTGSSPFFPRPPVSRGRGRRAGR